MSRRWMQIKKVKELWFDLFVGWQICCAHFEWTFQTFSDICHHIDRGGMKTKRLILHGDDVNIGGWWYCIVFLISHFLAANAMHRLSALFRRPLLVGEKVSYFPFVEKHFLFLAQALNCWIPAGKGEFSILYMWIASNAFRVFVRDCIRKNASSKSPVSIWGSLWYLGDVWGLMSEVWGFRCEVWVVR